MNALIFIGWDGIKIVKNEIIKFYYSSVNLVRKRKNKKKVNYSSIIISFSQVGI